MSACDIIFASYMSISPWSAELCLRARQLGLSGEAAAADQILAERKHQASQEIKTAASTGTAANYQAAVVTAQAAAVEAAVLCNAAATFSARCAEAAEALSTAAESGTWVMFASAREVAADLQQDVQDAEAVMSQRRCTVSSDVAVAVDGCMQVLPLEQGSSLLTSKHVNEHQPPSSQSSLLPCSECSTLTESPHSHTTKTQPWQGTGTNRGLFHASADSYLHRHSHAGHIVTAITQTISTIPLDIDKPDWEVAIAALVDIVSPAKAARGRSTRSSPAAAFAAAVTDARQLGLLQTVELALQTLLAQAQLQLQTQQAVVAEFGLPTQEHPQELCTKAWQHAMSMQQVTTQVASCTITTAAMAEAHHEHLSEDVASASFNCWDGCLAETEVEEAEDLGSQLVAKLQAGEHLSLG